MLSISPMVTSQPKPAEVASRLSIALDLVIAYLLEQGNSAPVSEAGSTPTLRVEVEKSEGKF